MKRPIFITGNEGKARYLAQYLDIALEHQKVELEEIQSLNLKEIVYHKVREAHKVVQKPVLVEDVSLEFVGLNGLPGPFIKWFLDKLTFEEICRFVDGKSRAAVAKCTYGYFDGTNDYYFEGELEGVIPEHPQGEQGFGWNSIFVPKGYSLTMSELGETDYKEVYCKIRPIPQLKKFLAS